MDLGSILLILSVSLLVILFISKPIFEDRGEAVSQADQIWSALLAERERLLDTLQELDFDYKLGKIPENDYPIQRTRLLQKGTEILKQLDSIDAAGGSGRTQSDAVEKAIADRRAAAHAGPRRPVAADDDVERLIAARKRERATPSAGFCPQCGQAVQQLDTFCSKCGQLMS